MLPVMARYALSWGAGTHFDELGTIGKFGFGLPNASINQTTRVEVYTKTRDADEVTMACLDVSHVKEHALEAQGVCNHSVTAAEALPGDLPFEAVATSPGCAGVHSRACLYIESCAEIGVPERT